MHAFETHWRPESQQNLADFLGIATLDTGSRSQEICEANALKASEIYRIRRPILVQGCLEKSCGFDEIHKAKERNSQRDSPLLWLLEHGLLGEFDVNYLASGTSE